MYVKKAKLPQIKREESSCDYYMFGAHCGPVASLFYFENEGRKSMASAIGAG